MIPSLEGWPTKAKEAPSPHEVRLTPLDTNPVFQNLGGGIVKRSIRENLKKRIFHNMKSEKNPKSYLAVYILIKGRKTQEILFVTLKKLWEH